MKKLMTLTALGTLLVYSDALASGFNLKEQSAAAMGNAFAGATAGAEDISYSFFNPAGLTRHGGTKVSFGGTWMRRAQKPNGPSPIFRANPVKKFPVIPVILFTQRWRRIFTLPTRLIPNGRPAFR